MDSFLIRVAWSHYEDGQHTADLGVAQKVEVSLTTNQATVHSWWSHLHSIVQYHSLHDCCSHRQERSVWSWLLNNMLPFVQTNYSLIGEVVGECTTKIRLVVIATPASDIAQSSWHLDMQFCAQSPSHPTSMLQITAITLIHYPSMN